MTRYLLMLICFLSVPATAAEVFASRENGQVNLRMDALPYPPALQRELTSGLTNRILVRVSLLEGGAVLQQRTAEIAIRYDLWDQAFTLTADVAGKVRKSTFADLGQLNAFLASLEIPGVFAVASLPADRDLIISAELLLNPIDREKLGMIRKWVAENSTPQAGGDTAVSSNSELFNRIFEQYADGSQFAATWRVVVTSHSFRLNTLPDEKH